MAKTTGYLGSESLQNSGAGNFEIIPNKPEWTNGYILIKLEFINDQDCTILINNEVKLFLRAGQGFFVNENSKPIHSLKVITPNVNFNWNGEY